MSLLDAEEPSSGRGLRWLTLVVLVGATAAAIYFLMPFISPGEREVAERTERVDRPPSAPVPAAREPAPAVETAPEPEPAAPEPQPVLAPIVPEATLPRLVLLRVTADVEGADVFIDRRFVGTTPFEMTDVEPGPHRINVSASGYESHLEEVEIDDQLTEVSVTFREVRLSQRVAVVHKHRFGNCEGSLVADLNGIRYETDDDAFTLPLAELEEFEVDYLEHNLRIKQRGGRTYNFTDHAENADALFVFHREVGEARARLARGDALAGH